MTFTTRNDLHAFIANIMQNMDFSEGPNFAESVDIVTDHLKMQDDWQWGQDMAEVIDREIPDADAIYAMLEDE